MGFLPCGWIGATCTAWCRLTGHDADLKNFDDDPYELEGEDD